MRLEFRRWYVASLFFGSGVCALIYQAAWLREFRLIFGASTAATAAVLGIFMGGLGAGSILLSRRAENAKNPLRFYAQLEALIAVSAAFTPFLLWTIRHAYLAIGGTPAMGLVLGTIVRLALSVIALGFPTFLMGGTLPAIARAVVAPGEINRRSIALFYGVNTLGAVVGVTSATFFLFEAWGNHLTLYMASAVNAVVAAAAFAAAKLLSPNEPRARLEEVDPIESEPRAPTAFVLVAAGVAGFAFLLMELVWYRMLGPLLGGSTFTFGLILAVALLGIGLGGLLYAFIFANVRTTLNGFALVCGLEALWIILPYAVGDRISLATLLLRPLGTVGFYWQVMGWGAICLFVALPAAIVSGIQFPFLISLLGSGRIRVGSHTGMAYACNTGGAIIGSIAGGFGLLPAFTAPGCWRLVALLLCLLATAAACISITHRLGTLWRALPVAALIVATLWLTTATGPTAFWRHGQIAAGRLDKFIGVKLEYHEVENAVRRSVIWEAEGIESTVALGAADSLAFIVNGRCDGNAKGDAGTQLMTGLIPAALHSDPKRSLVIGLGTGSTAGWLAAIPSMEKVDVVELEPSIVYVAQQCDSVNHHALNNPKVHLIIGDGREVLLSGNQKYDVIASEPSNPYRAGVASLFTREFYQAAANRLNPGGLFAQWVQAYDVDVQTIRTIYATLGSVFSNITTWQTQEGDLLFVASSAPPFYNANVLRRRIAEEPWRSALINAWGVNSLEGFLARFVGDNSLALTMGHGSDVSLNTDDRTVLEFTFARDTDVHDTFRVHDLRIAAETLHCNQLNFSLGAETVNWDQVDTSRLSMLLTFGTKPDVNDYSDEDARNRVAAYANYTTGHFPEALRYWRARQRDVGDLNDLRLVAECLADARSDDAIRYIDQLRETAPIDADAILAHLLLQRGEFDQATEVLENVFRRLRTDPWQSRELTQRTLTTAQRVAVWAPSDVPARRLYQALSSSFSVYNSDENRRIQLLDIAVRIEKARFGEYTLRAIEASEPHVPWHSSFLKLRSACYQAVGSPRADQAARDLKEFVAEQPVRLGEVRLAKETVPDKGGAGGYATEKQKP